VSFEEVLMARVICDGCGEPALDGEFYDRADEERAAEDAEEDGWLIPGDGTHWCDDCTSWDGERGERVPKPRAVEAQP
jgi:hypothetical protein